MAESYENRTWITAYAALPKRHKVFIAIGIIGAISIAIILLLSFLFGIGPFKLKKYPDSNLSQVGEAQTYRHNTYDDLPVQVRFLGTNYGINVGGKMIHEEETGASFLYDDDTVIITSVGKKGDDFYSAIENNLAKYMGGSDAVAYGEAASDEGYFNRLYFYYHTGALNFDGYDNRLISYVHPTEEGDLLYMIIVTSDESKLKNDRDLLERMIETFAFYQPSDADEAKSSSDTKTSALTSGASTSSSSTNSSSTSASTSASMSVSTSASTSNGSR